MSGYDQPPDFKPPWRQIAIAVLAVFVLAFALTWFRTH
jgi:hypothetical protein